MRFAYSVWFRDTRLPPDDQDYEWPACYVVEATDAQAALNWGDHLARKHESENGEVCLRSDVEADDVCDLPGIDALPVVRDGAPGGYRRVDW